MNFKERAMLELEKAKQLLRDFEALSAQDIKNIILFLMNALNFGVSYLQRDATDVETDFYVLNVNRSTKRDMCELYFFLKNLSFKDFRKAGKDAVTANGWKNSVFLKKSYFEELVKRVQRLLESL